MNFWHCCRRWYSRIKTVRRNVVGTCTSDHSSACSERPHFAISLNIGSQYWLAPNDYVKPYKYCSRKISIYCSFLIFNLKLGTGVRCKILELLFLHLLFLSVQNWAALLHCAPTCHLCKVYCITFSKGQKFYQL